MRISKFGVILILAGILLIMSTYNVFNLELSRDWPWILIIVGVLVIIDSGKSAFRQKRKKSSISKGERIELLNKLSKNEIDVDEVMRKFK